MLADVCDKEESSRRLKDFLTKNEAEVQKSTDLDDLMKQQVELIKIHKKVQESLFKIENKLTEVDPSMVKENQSSQVSFVKPPDFKKTLQKRKPILYEKFCSQATYSPFEDTSSKENIHKKNFNFTSPKESLKTLKPPKSSMKYLPSKANSSSTSHKRSFTINLMDSKSNNYIPDSSNNNNELPQEEILQASLQASSKRISITHLKKLPELVRISKQYERIIRVYSRVLSIFRDVHDHKQYASLSSSANVQKYLSKNPTRQLAEVISITKRLKRDAVRVKFLKQIFLKYMLPNSIDSKWPGEIKAIYHYLSNLMRYLSHLDSEAEKIKYSSVNDSKKRAMKNSKTEFLLKWPNSVKNCG
ncbi:unnamed protein product [Moneuplotes crassus]|uniref:Uncharacterized protein n=1 Tax=Euplotes crassus TaxID=5936 RepID=A0AAD1Y8D5_EUPCR|nr:unnamed protein product [Moneuplotes crassus]